MLVSSENMALELAEIYIKKRIWKYRFNKSKNHTVLLKRKMSGSLMEPPTTST